MKYKVLVIDDEFLIRVSLEDGLTDLGYQVETAASIKAGLEAVERFRPDAVLLDNRLGTEVGTDYIETIKKKTKKIKLITSTLIARWHRP